MADRSIKDVNSQIQAVLNGSLKGSGGSVGGLRVEEYSIPWDGSVEPLESIIVTLNPVLEEGAKVRGLVRFDITGEGGDSPSFVVTKTMIKSNNTTEITFMNALLVTQYFKFANVGLLISS